MSLESENREPRTVTQWSEGCGYWVPLTDGGSTWTTGWELQQDPPGRSLSDKLPRGAKTILGSHDLHTRTQTGTPSTLYTHTSCMLSTYAHSCVCSLLTLYKPKSLHMYSAHAYIYASQATHTHLPLNTYHRCSPHTGTTLHCTHMCACDIL